MNSTEDLNFSTFKTLIEKKIQAHLRVGGKLTRGRWFRKSDSSCCALGCFFSLEELTKFEEDDNFFWEHYINLLLQKMNLSGDFNWRAACESFVRGFDNFDSPNFSSAHEDNPSRLFGKEMAQKYLGKENS